MKIVFFGDSLTWGGYGGSYVDEIAQLRPDDEIINAGVGGNTVYNLVQRVEEDAIDQDPDGVFVMVGGNDTTSYTQPATRPYYEQVQNIPNGVVTPDLFASSYRDLLSQLQLAHIQVWMGLPPKEYNPETVAAMHEYNAIAAGVARSFNVPTLDLMAALKPDHIPQRKPIDIGFINLIGKRAREGWDDYAAEQERGGFTFTFDGLHFTPEAAKRVARWVSDFIDAN